MLFQEKAMEFSEYCFVKKKKKKKKRVNSWKCKGVGWRVKKVWEYIWVSEWVHFVFEIPDISMQENSGKLSGRIMGINKKKGIGGQKAVTN